MLIDASFAILVFFACMKGARQGMIMALFSLAAFIIGLAAALKLSAVVANRLSENVHATGKWLPIFSFLLVFIGVVLLVNMGGKFIQGAVKMAMLGWANKIAGMLLYIFLYGFIFSIFLFYAVQLGFIKTATTKASVIYPYIYPLAPKVINALGAVIPFFKDLFAQLELFFEGVSNKMGH